ncbi:hypothetical protein [Paenibacillus humicus]|uniref:hypothetical protein n=1 Tax=Paenibacillus humicus TaxID=412861 RepID=UPI003F5CCED4
MKLLHQINLAFGAVLIVVLGTAALLIHFVLLDHFIGSQQQELRTMGASIASSLEVKQAQASFSSAGMAAVPTTDAMKPDLTIGSIGKSPLIDTAKDNFRSSGTGTKTYKLQSRATVLAAADVQAIVTDPSGNIVTDSVALPSGVAAVPAELQGVRLSSQSAQAVPAAATLKELWTGADSRYMVQVNEVPAGHAHSARADEQGEGAGAGSVRTPALCARRRRRPRPAAQPVHNEEAHSSPHGAAGGAEEGQAAPVRRSPADPSRRRDRLRRPHRP